MPITRPDVAKKRPSAASKPKNVVAAARSGGGPRVDPRKFWEGFKSLAATVAIFLLLRTFLLEAYRIPSGSMIPTLLVGDWLFVNKLRFGPHVPFTQTRLPGYAEPRRGDVVVFVSPFQDWRISRVFDPNDPTPTVVKRMIGMPGDTLYSREGVVHVDGVPQRLGYAAAADGAPGDWSDPAFAWQTRVSLDSTRFGPAPARPTLDDWGPFVVPEGHYFMMGDNRYNSVDARYYGFVPRDNIRGRPLFVYYSWNADDSDRPLPFITDIRWSRLGHVIR
ncbi:MAG: signal peptidase I [Gemmatimonadaceae bacterium]|nr:signal peptidase I [Gemmatimonadaceae bacterium]